MKTPVLNRLTAAMGTSSPGINKSCVVGFSTQTEARPMDSATRKEYSSRALNEGISHGDALPLGIIG